MTTLIIRDTAAGAVAAVKAVGRSPTAATATPSLASYSGMWTTSFARKLNTFIRIAWTAWALFAMSGLAQTGKGFPARCADCGQRRSKVRNQRRGLWRRRSVRSLESAGSWRSTTALRPRPSMKALVLTWRPCCQQPSHSRVTSRDSAFRRLRGSGQP